MQRYYWAAKTVTQLNTILLQNIEAQLFPAAAARRCAINERFNEVNGLIDIAADDDLSSERRRRMLEAVPADDSSARRSRA